MKIRKVVKLWHKQTTLTAEIIFFCIENASDGLLGIYIFLNTFKDKSNQHVFVSQHEEAEVETLMHNVGSESKKINLKRFTEHRSLKNLHYYIFLDFVTSRLLSYITTTTT